MLWEEPRPPQSPSIIFVSGTKNFFHLAPSNQALLAFLEDTGDSIWFLPTDLPFGLYVAKQYLTTVDGHSAR